MDSSTNLGENISKSSLVSLKAELLRKHQEVKQLQNLSNTTDPSSSGLANCAKYREKPVTKLNINEKSNNNVNERNKKDLKNHPETIEEAAELRQSHDALEAKSKIYDALMKGKKVLDSSSQILVNFDEKLKDSRDDNEVDDKMEEDDDSDDEWTEFTDALGRTRKCLKEDLKHYQAQNQYLEHIKQGTDLNQETNKTEDEYPKQAPPPLLSAELLSFDMKRELLRKQWEEHEHKLEGKGAVHYSDILYGEARQHGVSYYEFSSDETERAKQIDKLNKLRDETREKREKARQMRRLRKKQFKTRLMMTENRKRVSQGLPPLELDLDNLSSSEDEADKREREEEERRKQELINDMVAKKLEEIRKANKTREWDVGKDGQMSQEEWIDKQREERKQEFAPPSANVAEGEDEEGNEETERRTERGERKTQDRHMDRERKRKRSRFDDERPDAGGKDRKNTNREELSDEQLLKKMESQEAYAKSSIFCFKSKWAERNKEVFKKYQKSSPTSSNENSIYSEKRSRKEPLNIVDTRYVGNKEKKMEIQGVTTTKKEKFEDKNDVEILETQNVTEKKELGLKSDVPEKVGVQNVLLKEKPEDRSEVEQKEEAEKVDLEESLREMESLLKRSKEKYKDTGTKTSEEVPTDTKTSSTNQTEPGNKSAKKTSTFGGLIIPQRFMKLNKTVQKKPSAESDSKIPNKNVFNQAETSNKVHVENNSDLLIGPPIPTEVNETKSSQSAMKDNVLKVSSSVGKTSDSSSISQESSKNTMNSGAQEMNTSNKIDSINEIGPSNEIRPSNEVDPSNGIDASNEIGPSVNTDSSSKEDTTMNGGTDDSSTKDTAPSELLTDAGENSSSTNFNFFNAKSKAANLKRKLDKPNVEFSASGKIVNKAKPPSCVNPFRSLPRGVEEKPEDTRSDSRSSTKRVEIAPPSTFDYFGPSGAGVKRKGGRGGGGNKMLESVSVGMKKVEDKKKENRGKREKGLLDIM
uniref:Coiled-coil domain-containing protein 174 n=1 Tax=Cacopsylla melanoneura TaxID=428564 RepID=A0A8D8ZUP5_9HEMI